MSRLLLPVSILCLAVSIAFYALPGAHASSSDAAKCYPAEKVLLSQGSDATKVAASAQVLIGRQVGEGRKNAMMVEVGGTKTMCFW